MKANSYDELARKMDARDAFYKKLDAFYIKHGYIPAQYAKEWEAHKKDGFKSWRTMPKVVKRIKKAAKKCGK